MRRHRRSAPFDGSSAARTPPSPMASSGTPRALARRSISPRHTCARRMASRSSFTSAPRCAKCGGVTIDDPGQLLDWLAMDRAMVSFAEVDDARNRQSRSNTSSASGYACVRERPADYRLAPVPRIPRRPGRRNMQRTSGIVEKQGDEPTYLPSRHRGPGDPHGDNGSVGSRSPHRVDFATVRRVSSLDAFQEGMQALGYSGGNAIGIE